MASSLAFGTNLDINSIVTQLMTVEKRPLTLLSEKQAKLETKISSYGMIKGAMGMKPKAG